MTIRFDRILIAVPDLQQAGAECEVLFGAHCEPVPVPGDYPGLWMVLSNTVLEFQQRDVEQASVCGLVLATIEADTVPAQIVNDLQLELYQCDGADTNTFRDAQGCVPSDISRVDHVVLRTSDADACVALFRDRLGLRLALDQTVPKWGGRMLFFRAGKLTLEIIDAQEENPGPDYFWGLAYQCETLANAAAGMAARGVELSGIREGRKAGTLVATPRSHVLGIPTLLVQPAGTI
jgi:catechol 2,3-dioxygenase-like lactoylglutathione lyase family enzyme